MEKAQALIAEALEKKAVQKKMSRSLKSMQKSILAILSALVVVWNEFRSRGTRSNRKEDFNDKRKEK